MRALSTGALAIPDQTVGGPDDDNVVPFDRAAAREGQSRGRHPAGGARRGDEPDDLDDPDVGPIRHERPRDLTSDADVGLPSERSIAFGLVEGRRWALAAAFERWADLVHGVARTMVGHDHADDVTQLVFVEAWGSRRSFSPELGEVPGWLVGITRNVARGHIRRQGPDTLEVTDALDADETTPGADRIVDSLLVANAMRDLPTEQRDVLELTLVGEYTHIEAADRLGLPLGTLKTRHRRGLERLRKALSAVPR